MLDSLLQVMASCGTLPLPNVTEMSKSNAIKTKARKKRAAAVAVVGAGNVAIKIYDTSYTAANGKNYVQFSVPFSEGGKRRRVSSATLAGAKEKARRIAERLNSGRREATRLTSADDESYTAARRELAPLGVPLLDAVRQYVAAAKALPAGASLLSAAKEYAQRHPDNAPEKTVAEVIAEFLEIKRQDKLSYRYLKTLTSTLAPNAEADGESSARKRKSFGDAFRCNVDGVTTADMDAWLRARNVEPRTRRNLVLILRTLFNFAKGQGYLAKGMPTEADTLTLPKKTDGNDIGIFTPQQMATLLNGTKEHPAADEYRLWIALGGFAGLRTAELLRLEWGKHVQIENGLIQVTTDIAKANGRRIVAMQPNLIDWLAPYAGRAGKVFEPRADERAHAYAKRMKIEWKPNALRHSFISYLVAKSNDLGAVSLEAGNSVAIINRHYRKLVTASEGMKWFAISPSNPPNVVQMKGAA